MAGSSLAGAAPVDPCTLDPGSSLCADSTGKSDINTIVTAVANILLYAVGAAAVIVIIISALRFTISSGNPQAVEGAKKALIGSVIGLLIVVLAVVIVNWVTTLTT